MAKPLTAQAVEKLRPDASKRLEIPDGLLPGLYLVIQPQPSGRKSWAVRYRYAGAPRKLTLGPYPALDLATARARARDELQKAAAGRDPASEKQDTKRQARDGRNERDRVAHVVEQYLNRYVIPNNKERTAAEAKRLLQKEVVGPWGERRIQDITRRDVIGLLDGIVDRGAPVTANRVLAALRTMFGWCIERAILEHSPCDRVKAPTVETSRDRVLGDDELRLVWKASERSGWPFGPFVRLLALTGTRRTEVAGMRWSEINEAERLWTIPAERTKNGNVHDVPLSEPAMDVLRSLPRIGNKPGFVFSTTGETPISGYSGAKERLDAFMLEIARAEAHEAGRDQPEALRPWRFHDLRRTVASGMARIGIDLPVIEKVLNHTSGSFAGVVGVYQRHSFADEKRRALEAWGRFVLGLFESCSEAAPAQTKGGAA